MADAFPSEIHDTLAAVDLGSNSFHMIVARVADGELQVIDRLREMVRLGEGLTEDKRLRPEVGERALACLERFGQRVRAMPLGSVRAVGTNTLRQLQGEEDFLRKAEAALGHPIEVIAGREEARLIYLGVAHGLATGDDKRLVVDIGGGSTELIVGRNFQPEQRESLHIGCVGMSQRFFSTGAVTAAAMHKAALYGGMEIRPVREEFRNAGWKVAIGSSGTIKAIRDVVVGEGWSQDLITAEALDRLVAALVERGHLDKLQFKGLSPERAPVFAGGVAVLQAVFKHLGIEHMQVSDLALREGLLYEMTGRSGSEGVHDNTVEALERRYQVDAAHARRVENTVMALYGQVVKDWELGKPQYQAMLSWAARLHEIGLNVSHSQYHKHGAYLIGNSDLPGFSLREQAVLSVMVRGHRRKIPLSDFQALPEPVQQCTLRLSILLRLAILVHRGRSASNKPMLLIDVDGGRIGLRFPGDWLDSHPLTRAELELEAERLQQAGYSMTVA